MESIQDELSLLQQSEWERLSGISFKDASLLHGALGHILRGYRYLELIHERHVPTARRYKELLSNMFTKMDPAFAGGAIQYDDEMASMDAEMGDLLDVAHIDLETFYLFSKIVLDRVAQYVELYFGPERGLPARTHEKWRDNFHEYASRRGMVLPDGFSEALRGVNEFVYEHEADSATNDSRQAQSPSDLMIAHTERAPGGGSPITRLSLTTGQLLVAVDTYLRTIVALVQVNPSRARLLQKRRVTRDPKPSSALPVVVEPPTAVPSFETYQPAEESRP